MISSVFTPDGIVLATLSIDIFYEMNHNHIANVDTLSSIMVRGHQHCFSFWDRYVVVFRKMNMYSYDNNLLIKMHEYENTHQKSIPNFLAFLDDYKSIIHEYKNDLVSVIGGYSESEPFVVCIQGENISRINVTDKNKIIYNCHFIEQNEIVGRLFRDIKILNGDNWEDRKGLHTRCDLFSLEKAIDLCKFMLYTNYYVNNLNKNIDDCKLLYEMAIVKNNKVEIKYL